MYPIFKYLYILLHPDQCEFKLRNIVPRPNAGPGIWLAFLLPIAVITGVLKNPTSSVLYHNVGAVCAGLLFTTMIFVFNTLQYKPKKSVPESSHMPTLTYVLYFVPSVLISTVMLLFICKNGFLQSVFGGIFSTYPFAFGILLVLQSCPKCFTFGEASVILQAIILFLYATLTNLHDGPHMLLPQNYCINISTIILQVGWLGIGSICSVVFCFPKFRTVLPFYGISAGILLGIVIPALHMLLQASPVLWILQLLVAEWLTIWVVAYWVICSTLAVLAVCGQIQDQQKASTVVRKYFHILAVAVFIPGLVYENCLLYLASGIVMALFVVLELLRVLNIPPLGSTLQEGFSMYVDDKDQGGLSLTPLYLLGGCALPLWLHPAPSRDSLLPLLSGILAIGIGDTAASVCGTTLGRHHWSGGPKTIEGTLGCFLSQVATVSLTVYFGYIEGSTSVWIRCLVSIASTSLIEAKTDQVDNLALPLVMYILLL